MLSGRVCLYFPHRSFPVFLVSHRHQGCVYADISVNYRNTMFLSRARLLSVRSGQAPRTCIYNTRSSNLKKNVSRALEPSLYSFCLYSQVVTLLCFWLCDCQPASLCTTLAVLPCFKPHLDLDNEALHTSALPHKSKLCHPRCKICVEPITLLDSVYRGDVSEQEESCAGRIFKPFIGDSRADDGVKGNTIVIHRHTKAMAQRRAGGGTKDRRLPGGL